MRYNKQALQTANNNLRPDGVTNELWLRGQQLICDVSIRDAYATCYRRIARNARAVVEKGEQDKKTNKKTFETLPAEYCLVPFVIDTSGVWGEAALRLVKELSNKRGVLLRFPLRKSLDLKKQIGFF